MCTRIASWRQTHKDFGIPDPAWVLVKLYRGKATHHDHDLPRRTRSAA
ncbi:MAG: hypothetical protein ACYCV4_02540 [Dermatophilaceae bacterium]